MSSPYLRKVGFLCFASFLLAAPAFAQQLDEWTVSHFNRAMQAQRANDLETAETEYRLITSRNPRFAGAYLNLGIVYHQQKKYTDAVNVLKTAVQLDPHVLGSQLFLGIDEYLTQDFKGALDHLRKALGADPKDKQAELYLGFDYMALNQPFEAIRVLRQSAKYHPDDAEVLYHFGEAHLKAAQQAIAFVNKLGDQSALTFWSLAIAAKQKKDTIGMLEDCMKALALDPYIAELYWEVATTLQGKMPELAGAALARYQLLDPDHARLPEVKGEETGTPIDEADQASLNHLWHKIPEIRPGVVAPAVADTFVNQALAKREKLPGSLQLKVALRLYAQEKYEESAKTLGDAGARTSDWSLAYLKALSYERGGDHEEAEKIFSMRLLPYMEVPSVSFLAVRIESPMALKCLNDVLNAQPDSYTAKLLLGKYHAVQNQDDLALTEYQEALKLAPNQLGIHLLIGDVYASQPQWLRAIEEYRAELVLDPVNYIALAQLGHALTETRDASNAVPVLQRALHANPDNAAAYADLGKVWEMQGESEKAIQAYESALRYDPNQFNLHYKLSRLYRKQGQTEQAQKELAAFQSGQAQEQKDYRKTMDALQN